MISVKLEWITPDAEQLISRMARVSAPENQHLPPGKLLAYCVRNAHWSIFEMVNACVEIETTRDIARQILRHRSFSFQEFSQRYATVDKLPMADLREARLQDTVNRQNSIETDDAAIQVRWAARQERVRAVAMEAYQESLNDGIAKEVARAVLPEGLTTSRMYMNGNLRSWMHFCQLRSGNGTQKECMAIAKAISAILMTHFPKTWEALMEPEAPAEAVEAPVVAVEAAKVETPVKFTRKRLKPEEKAMVDRYIEEGASTQLIMDVFGIGFSTVGKMRRVLELAKEGV